MRIHCICCMLLVVGVYAKDLSRAQLAERGKGITAFVETEEGSGSAFCIHDSGLFITNAHVVSKAKEVSLTLNSGQSGQATLKASVLRFDEDLDLALLSVAGKPNQTFEALPFGDADSAYELMQVAIFGYPFGKAMASDGDHSPAISINLGTISSLRVIDDELRYIQLDGAVNPGNSGGPLLSMNGEVLGVIVGRLQADVGAGLDLAIPVNILRAFLLKPVIKVEIPELTEENASQPLPIQAKAVSFFDPELRFDLKMRVAWEKNQGEFVEMKPAEDGYSRASTVLFPEADKLAKMSLKVRFADGVLEGLAHDRPLTIGKANVRLSELKSITQSVGSTKSVCHSGVIYGDSVAGLEAVDVEVGGQTLSVNLSSALLISLGQSDQVNSAVCTFRAYRDGVLVGTYAETVFLGNAQEPSLESIRDEIFLRPGLSPNDSTYLHVISTAGDYIGGGKEYSYSGDDLKVSKSSRGLSISVDGWNILFGGPARTFLATGIYLGAKRHPFSDNSPGIEFTGHGRGCNTIAGAFAVWELELTPDGAVQSAAIDFVQRCEGGNKPLYGRLRYHSKYR